MIPATELKTSVVFLSLLQQIDIALFNKVFGYGKARHALTKGALAISKSGDGYAQLLSPLLVWWSGNATLSWRPASNTNYDRNQACCDCLNGYAVD